MTSVLPFYLTVDRVERLSENFLRVTLVGDDLHRFGVPGDTLDLRIKVVLPGSKPLLDYRELMTDDGWYPRWQQIDPEVRGTLRTYTAREFRDGARPELDIDFVLHLGESSGPASRWADAAAAGDPLLVLGPNRESEHGRLGIEWSAGSDDTLLVVADETGVPAVAAILESLPETATGQVLLEVPVDGDALDLRAPDGVGVRWFARNGADRGVDVIDAVRSIVRSSPQTPAGDVSVELDEPNIDEEILWETTREEHGGFYAFIAGEASTVKTIRRYLVSECGIDRKSVSFMGYWREGRAEG